MDNTELASAIGKAIRRARKHNGWTQGELAQRCGMRQRDISRFESGTNLAQLPALVAVFRGLGFDTVRLVAGKRGARATVVRLT